MVFRVADRLHDHRVLRAGVRLVLRRVDRLLHARQPADGHAGQGQININTMAIRPLLQNVSVVALFVLPLITMRTYAEEKRSGTIELLLTSPLTDFQIIMGKFLGAVALYALMLAVTLIHIAHPVHLRQPGVEADCVRLPGPAADGRVVHLDRPA